MADIKLFHGNCLKIIPTLKNNSIDCVITSPPYNLGIEYNKYEDKLSIDEYFDFIVRVFVDLRLKLTPTASIFLNVMGYSKQPTIPHLLLGRLCEHYILQNTFIWVKSIAIEDVTYGHFKPINSQRYVNSNFEYVFHLSLDGKAKLNRLAVGVPFMDKTNIKRRNHSKDLRCQGNVWFIPYETRNKSLLHPASFPVKLPEYCIKLCGAKRVLDPFMGSGTTLLAAQSLNVNAIGIELDKTYITIAKERLG